MKNLIRNTLVAGSLITGCGKIESLQFNPSVKVIHHSGEDNTKVQDVIFADCLRTSVVYANNNKNYLELVESQVPNINKNTSLFYAAIAEAMDPTPGLTKGEKFSIATSCEFSPKTKKDLAEIVLVANGWQNNILKGNSNDGVYVDLNVNSERNNFSIAARIGHVI